MSAFAPHNAARDVRAQEPGSADQRPLLMPPPLMGRIASEACTACTAQALQGDGSGGRTGTLDCVERIV
jgi:hypothetical protein